MPERHLNFDTGGFEADKPEMNMTPMIDVVFLLIIFFMVAYQLSESQASGRVDLPVASHAYPKARRSPNTIVIEILNGGGIMQPLYVVGGRTFVSADWSDPTRPDPDTGSWKDLRTLLTRTVELAEAQMDPVPPVMLHADRRVKYKYVQRLMALCAELGIRQFSFEARQPSDR